MCRPSAASVVNVTPHTTQRDTAPARGAALRVVRFRPGDRSSNPAARASATVICAILCSPFVSCMVRGEWFPLLPNPAPFEPAAEGAGFRHFDVSCRSWNTPRRSGSVSMINRAYRDR